MSFTAVPSTFFGAGYSLAGNAISMNTNTAGSNKTLVELTDAEANATSGDWRKIVFALMEKLATAYAAIEVADRPTKVTIAKYATLNAETGVITNQYTVTCINDLGAQEVADEPVA